MNELLCDQSSSVNFIISYAKYVCMLVYIKWGKEGTTSDVALENSSVMSVISLEFLTTVLPDIFNII